MTAIIDYKAGNLTSVKLAFAALGEEATVTRDAAVIAAAPRVVFPGVGAAKSAMANLRDLGLVDVVKRAAASVETLGILPGAVRRFPDAPGCKIPQIGWNQCVTATDAIDYYFVHSYYAELGPYTVGRTDYAGVTFTSMVRKGNLLACQFHPEKSGRRGLDLLKGWLAC